MDEGAKCKTEENIFLYTRVKLVVCHEKSPISGLSEGARDSSGFGLGYVHQYDT